MMEAKIIAGTFVALSVYTAIVSAFVAAWTAQRKISIENITQDRRVWREKVRDKALSVHDSLISRNQKSLDKLRAEFRAILNPMDKEDQDIIKCIYLPENGKELERAEQFAERIALLLKHDWQRAKWEAGPFIKRVMGVRAFFEPKRKKYDDYVKEKQQHESGKEDKKEVNRVRRCFVLLLRRVRRCFALRRIPSK